MENLNLFIRSIFIDNMIFAYFLGMCSYLAVSKNVKTAIVGGGRISQNTRVKQGCARAQVGPVAGRDMGSGHPVAVGSAL